MQLKPGERILLAYFTDKASAKRALSALQDAGFKDMQIDSLAYSGSRPRGSGYRSLSSIVYGNTGYDRAYDPLFAADPQVSGMSSLASSSLGYNFILSLITDNDNYPIAASIIRQNGGRV